MLQRRTFAYSAYMSLDDRGYRLELHRRADVVDLTEHVVDVTDTHGRVQPYGGIDVALDLPLWHWDRLPGCDDWLVLRDADSGAALQVGVVDGPATGFRARPAVETKTTRVAAPTWLDFLGRTLVYTSGRLSTRGTLFGAKDWESLIATMTSLAEGGAIGLHLSRFIRRAANVALPPSLSSETLGRAVRVVHDAATAERFSTRAPSTVESVKGGSLQGVASFTGGVMGTPLLAMLQSIFWGSPQMVELFPSIEPALGSRRAAAPQDVARQVGLGAASAALAGATLAGGAVALATPQEFHASELAGQLLAHLALVHRVVPWRSRPLRESVAIAGGGFVDGMFEGVTWNPEGAPEVRAEEIEDADIAQSSSERINAVTANVPGTSELISIVTEETGLPIADWDSVDSHGLRLWNPAWPFFYGKSASSIEDVLQTVAAQGAQFMLGAERFWSGTIRLNRVRRDLRQGAPARFTIVREGKRQKLIAYVDRVMHRVNATAALEGATTAFVSRGLFDERQRGVQVRVDVPPKPIKPPAPPARSETQKKSATSPGGVILFAGKELPISWRAVRLFNRGDGLGLTSGFGRRYRAASDIDMAVLHWDVTFNARKTARVLAAKDVSTHFVIDWDGTIYQLVDAAQTAWHAGVTPVNDRSIGIDLNTPVRNSKTGDVTLLNKKLVALGQPARPIGLGWSVNGVMQDPFLACHAVQLDALRALAACLDEHVGVPRKAPGAGQRAALRYSSAWSPGWWHHAEVLRGKVDTCGVWLPDVFA